MSRYCDTVRAIVQQAGHLAVELRAQGLTHHIKADGTPVTSADIAVSEFLTQELLAAFPNTHLISEESTNLSGIGKDLIWAIDPIDGTKKYLAGKDVWCVMVGLFDTEPVFSMIFYPDLNVWYWAERGMGAWVEAGEGPKQLLMGEPAQPIRVQHATECTVKIGEKSSFGYMKHVRRLLWNKIDAYLRSSVNYWDLIPPMLLITEAGGVVLTFDGKPVGLTSPTAIAYDVVSGHPQAVANVIAQISDNY